MRATAYPDMATTDQLRGVPHPPLEAPVERDARLVPLPEPGTFQVAQVSVVDALEWWEPSGFLGRTSLDLVELSYLLWYTQGVREVVDDRVTLRHVPSCGNRHPLETYLVVSSVGGIPEGLYRYLPLEHNLVLLRPDTCLASEFAAACMNIPAVHRAPVTFVWTAVPYRAVWGLGDRGYRGVLIDAGHVCQALVMVAAGLACEVRPIDLFHDALANRLLGCDGSSEYALLMAAVGKREGRL
jgi:SagB-type dehydrogenase family enzyme